MSEDDFPELSSMVAILIGVICYLVAEAIGLIRP
jgi:hypothetical protein